MLSRRVARALVLLILSATTVIVPVALSTASPVTSVNDNARTLLVSLPGPFNGCTYLSASATPTSTAILDLVRPSAFLTLANGTLVGENGPIASAELTSLQPETVRYTLEAHQSWSNGAPFSGVDLVDWWRRARALASVTSDGYRALTSMHLSDHGLVVTAVFAKPYADWNLLFRDIEATSAPLGCAVTNLVRRPSLGPYRVASATSARIVLLMNKHWPLNTDRFGRVVISAASALPTRASTVYARYSLAVNGTQIQLLSPHPSLSSRISSSSTIEELTFAPGLPLTEQLAVREALSWSILRQSLIDRLFGAVTFSPSVAASALFSQGQNGYPGGGGTGLPTQTTTTVPNVATNGLTDCVACAEDVLRTSGFRRTSTGWLSNHGGGALTVRLAVGPTGLDHAVAELIKRDWKNIGIATVLINEPSDALAAWATASNVTDVSVFSRPTATAPSYAARSWAGPAYPDSFPSGLRIHAVSVLFAQAMTNFNPVAATSTWLRIDQIIMNHFWVRPLFTAPSLEVWSNTLASVEGSSLLAGFVDQIPTWTLTAPSS